MGFDYILFDRKDIISWLLESSFKMLTTLAAISILTQMLYLMIMPTAKKLNINGESVS